MTNLEGKMVLVTGASSGIGRAAAVAFAQEGASVVINYKSDEQAAQEVLAVCDAHSQGNMLARADISDEEQVGKMFEAIKEKFGHLDILINNAGIFDGSDSPTNVEVFDRIYHNNFRSVVLVTKCALELMKKGKIINISSIHGRLGYGRPSAAAYSAFKAALENYTENLAKDVAPDILVNAVAPGRVATPMWGNLSEKEKVELGQVHLTRRMIEPEEIADGIIFLAKNDSSCGEILTIDGGMGLVTLG